MLGRVLPRSIDNDYRGRKLALWLLGLLALVKLAMGLNCILNGDAVARGADGIPLDTFTPGGARAVVTLFAIWGLSQVILGLLCVLALLRYRAMVPLLFTLLLVEHLGRKAIVHYLPVTTTGSPPAPVINLTLLTVLLVGLALSLWSRASKGEQRPGGS